MRVIFHVDVNSAFLSWTAVDLLKKGHDVDIRTIPSVIGGDEEARKGIVVARSLVAKKYGISVPETLYSARKKCPHLQVFKGDYELYSRMSLELVEFLGRYSPVVEQYSVDECFMDMSNMEYLYDDLIKVAYKIKDEIYERFGYTVNVGIGNNKLCAKMASDFLKPNRVHTLFSHEIESKMWGLDVRELFMVGRRSSEELYKLGIKTIGDLAKVDVSFLKKHFKSFGELMWQYANGIDESSVMMRDEKNKCISVSQTLIKDTNDIRSLKSILYKQCEEVCLRLRKQEMYASVVAVLFKSSDFRSYSRQMTLSKPSNVTNVLLDSLMKLFDKEYNGELLRSIGVRLGNLTDGVNYQMSLFDDVKSDLNDIKIQKIMDNINEKYSDIKVTSASSKYYD